MIFKSDKFIYDGIMAEEMGIRLVDTNTKDVLTDYSIPFTETLKVETSFGGNPFYTYESSHPEKVELEFCLADENGKAFTWSQEWEEQIIEWFMKDRFCEFISMDYPDLVYYFRGTKVSRKRNKNLKGVLVVEFQPYYKHPIKKFKSTLNAEGTLEKDVRCDIQFKEFIYPILEIESTGDGDVTIQNMSIEDSQPLKITGLKNKDFMSIDNQLYIVTNKESQNLFSKVNREWFKLKKGKNKIKITGNAKVVIKTNLEVRV